MLNKAGVLMDTKEITDEHLHRLVGSIPGVMNIWLREITNYFWNGNDHLPDIFKMELPKIASGIVLSIP